jgi:hypothetical protein
MPSVRRDPRHVEADLALARIRAGELGAAVESETLDCSSTRPRSAEMAGSEPARLQTTAPLA